MSNINDYKFVFNIKSPHWDEDANSWKQSRPVTLGEILEYGQTLQIDFTDGGYMIAKEIDWQADEVIVCHPCQPTERRWKLIRSSKMRIAITHYEEPETDPFHFMGVRELARATGQDASNLSKYKNGLLPCPMKVYLKLCEAVDAKMLPANPTPQEEERE